MWWVCRRRNWCGGKGAQAEQGEDAQGEGQKVRLRLWERAGRLDCWRVWNSSLPARVVGVVATGRTKKMSLHVAGFSSSIPNVTHRTFQSARSFFLCLAYVFIASLSEQVSA